MSKYRLDEIRIHAYLRYGKDRKGVSTVTKPRINTMKELSAAIDISRPTLARYFEDPMSVRPSTAKKIETALKDVDYVYNFLATRQNRKSTGLIGVVIPHFKDLFFASLLDAIESAAREIGYTIITQSSQGDPRVEAQAIGKLRSMNVDGAIITPLGPESASETLAAAGRDFPLVFADSRPSTRGPEADFVGTDNVQSVGMLVDYLCRTGDAPVFLGMPRVNSNALEREDAYRERMSQMGHDARIIDPIRSSSSWRFEEYGFDTMDEYFSRRRYVDATILCANDRLAIGVVRAANKHGLFSQGHPQGGTFRIAGHDDHPMSRYVFPGLTTVAQDIDGIGRQAITLLANRLRGRQEGPPVTILKEAVLKVRESTWAGGAPRSTSARPDSEASVETS